VTTTNSYNNDNRSRNLDSKPGLPGLLKGIRWNVRNVWAGVK
jgi:hypothetical protein